MNPVEDPQEVSTWIGYRVDDIYGARVGRMDDLYVDSETNRPEWIVARLGRFSDTFALIPVADAIVGAGHVWVPFERDLIRSSPEITPGAAVSQREEAKLLGHYGTAPRRLGEIGRLAPGTITAFSVGGPSNRVASL